MIPTTDPMPAKNVAPTPPGFFPGLVPGPGVSGNVAGAPKPFDINEGVDIEKGQVMFPTLGGALYSAEDYFNVASQLVTGPGTLENSLELLKAGAVGAPNIQAFARVATMPNAYSQGIAQPPGIPFAVLKKLAEDHFAPKVIIQQRVADVMRYAEPSTQPWKPGWKVEMRQGLEAPTAQDRKDMAEASEFLTNCCENVVDARQRDEMELVSFRDFLAAIVRDTYRYDQVAVWTDMSVRDQVRAFKAMPAAQIRRALRAGYQGDKNVFAVGVDDGDKPIYTFTRKQLSLGYRNARTDPDTAGYGYSELEMAVRLVQGFTNAFELNVSIFDKNATPNGILTTQGNWTSKQLDVLSRIWANLKRGTSKTWALPVIPVPKEGKIEVLDLSNLKGNDAYYQDLTNMLAGLFCAIYQFPVSRLGYRVSGRGPDNNPKDHQSSATIIDESDPGLAPLLGFLERFINEYIIWSRYPRLQLRFQGKNPKEDARAYEAQMLSCTWDEKRALTDKGPVMALAKTPEAKEIMEIMGMAPVDPNLSASFMATIQFLQAKKAAEAAPADAGGGPGKQPGSKQNEMVSKRDPGKSLDHGHEAGVRRNSKAEKASAAASKKAVEKRPLYVMRPVLNSADIIGWAKRQGFREILDPHDLHVTVCWSRETMDWDQIPNVDDRVYVTEGGPRSVQALGDKGAVVLMFSNPELAERWQNLRDLGASWDYDGYRPHISITYNGLGDIDLSEVEPYRGPIVLGAECWDLPNENWADDKP